MRLIDADALVWDYGDIIEGADGFPTCVVYEVDIRNYPTIDAVPAEKYNELREAFVDFVCSGVNNPAPYCKNRCDECTNSYGWCTYLNCEGFNPDGERRSDG